MPTVADVVRRYGPEYLKRFDPSIPPQHRKVLDILTACRTGELGTVVFACSTCEHRHKIGRSCGNRHCPTCQQDKARAWHDKQKARLLACPYFLLTFTVPAQLRRFIRSHQRLGYDTLFDASSDAIKLLAADPKFLGTSRAGFFGHLHTWGRTLEYHPHIHYVVPGGGLSEDGSQWLPSRADFFVPVKALSKIFRAKFRDAIKQAGLLEQIDPAVWNVDWVVHSQPAGDGHATVNYLTPYVFRVAISDHRIRSLDDGQVTFSYRKTGSRRWRNMTLQAHEFLRRFLQHVLPHGFQKIRYYGFASSNAKHSFEAIRWLVSLHAATPFVLQAEPSQPTTPPPLLCHHCGGHLNLLGFAPFTGRASFDTS